VEDHLVSAGDKIRVVLCDDHDLFRSGLAEMLTTAEDIEVVGEANTHERALAVVSEARPDVVLLDLEMPGGGPSRRPAGYWACRARPE
jgi:DNA-binding NarL/FixJ family response regulator